MTLLDYETALPEGWERNAVAAIFRCFGGSTPSKANPAYWNGNIPWLSSGDIKADRISTSSDKITQAAADAGRNELCRAGAVVVVVRSGILRHTLPVGVLDIRAAINQDMKCFDSGDDALNEWLALALRANSVNILKLNREGTTVQSVKTETLSQFLLPIPPLAEQKRVVAKVEELLARVNAARARLAKVPALLKRFRQSVLAAACSGQLTADWRELHPNVEPAASALARLISNSPVVTKKKAGRLWGGGSVPDLLDDEREGIPETWTWAKVANIGYSTDDAVQVGPMSMQSRDFASAGVPVLNVGCVQYGSFDESKLDFMPNEKAAAFDRYRIRTGDVLFTRSGTIGRCAVAEVGQDGYLMTFHLLRVRVDDRRCLPQYAQFVFQGASHIRRQMEEAAIGSTRAGFNTTLLANLDVPLPPLDEQHEIIRRVEALFALADKIEARVQAATARVEKITQSILAKAFRGELVPTEAALARQEGRDYEPASALLARIRAQRETQASPSGRRVKSAKVKS